MSILSLFSLWKICSLWINVTQCIVTEYANSRKFTSGSYRRNTFIREVHDTTLVPFCGTFQRPLNEIALWDRKWIWRAQVGRHCFVARMLDRHDGDTTVWSFLLSKVENAVSKVDDKSATKSGDVSNFRFASVRDARSFFINYS